MTDEKDDTCKYCNCDYTKFDIERTHGVHSSVYIGGFCSAYCFTQHAMKKRLPKESKMKEQTVIEIKKILAKMKERTLRLSDLCTEILIHLQEHSPDTEKLSKWLEEHKNISKIK